MLDLFSTVFFYMCCKILSAVIARSAATCLHTEVPCYGTQAWQSRFVLKDISLYMRISIGVGHSPQTRSFTPAATFARVQLQNFCFRKRPSFLASRRSAQEYPTPCPDELFRLIKMCGSRKPLFGHNLLVASNVGYRCCS